jgi:hypothetical protein
VVRLILVLAVLFFSRSLHAQFPSVTIPTTVDDRFVPATIFCRGEQPGEMGVQVDRGAVVWTKFMTNYTVVLGERDGTYNVKFKFKVPTARGEQEQSSVYEVTLLHGFPEMHFTEPSVRKVSQPMIQLRGHCEQPIAPIRYIVSSRSHYKTGNGFLVERGFRASGGKRSTNWFQCFDVPLGAGENQVCIMAKDEADNWISTNLYFTFTTEGDTVPPQIQIEWPRSGSVVSGKSFDIRGRLDDFTAKIYGELVEKGKVQSKLEGEVYRDSEFSINSVPLLSPTNEIRITAIDAAGNTSVTNLTVRQSKVDLTIDPIAPELLLKPRVTVTGTIDAIDHAVFVNGIRAEVTNKVWIARDVPVPDKGTVTFSLHAQPLNKLPQPTNSE